jgi:hypothetical protein
MRQVLMTFVLALGMCLLSGQCWAATILIGTLSYDTFIPGGSVSPGIDAFNISNLTGSFDLPPDFPVSDSLTFQSASLTLTLGDLSQQVLDFGDIGPGFLLDPSGNPVVQVPGNEAFASAEFTATLSPGSFTLSDGTTFKADSTALDVVLDPSSGSTLVADVDQTTIGVTQTIAITTPEPASRSLVLLAFAGLVFWVISSAPVGKYPQVPVGPRLPPCRRASARRLRGAPKKSV